MAAKKWLYLKEPFTFNGNQKHYPVSPPAYNPAQLLAEGWSQSDIDNAIPSLFYEVDPPTEAAPVATSQPPKPPDQDTGKEKD